MFPATPSAAALLERPAFPDRDFADARFNALFHRSPVPKWIFDADTLAILEVNEAACRRYGYAYDEFLSLTILDLRPENERTAFMAAYRSASREARAVSVRHLTKSGDIIFAEISSRPIPMEGRANAQLVTMQEVTDKHRGS